MRFLYAAISYPNVNYNSNMYTSFVGALKELRHEVRVIAPCFDAATHVSEEGGIVVLRVKSGPIFNTNLIAKGINTILLNSRYTRALKSFWPSWKMDWILTSTPPITLSPLLKKLKAQYKAGLYLILRDIFPQNAKDLQMIKDPLLFAYFRQRERHLYKNSDIIGCMSPGNMEFLRRQDPKICTKDKLAYFPNWIHPTVKKMKNKDADGFRNRFKLEGKFVAIFGGNFGRPQKIEFILDLAQRVLHLNDIVFFLIGEGTEKEKIYRIVRDRGLKNVVIQNRLPRDEYQTIINEADIGLVNLSEKFSIPNIPSRTLGYWDASLPVLAATDKNTDLNKNFLKKYNAGLWAETGNLENYYNQFMRFYQDKELREKMGENGRKAVKSEFSSKAAAVRLLAQIEEKKYQGSLIC